MKTKIMHKGMVQKIAIAIIIVVLLNFAIPIKSNAVDLGGILLQPITDFVSMVGDVVMAALQMFMVDGNLGQGSTAGIGTGSFLKAFLLGAGEYNKGISVSPSDEDSYLSGSESAQNQDYPEIQYKQGEGVEPKVFNQEDIDQGWITALWETDLFGIPVTKYTPEKIFSGQIPALDINFIEPTDWTEVNQQYGDKMNDRSVAFQLHEIIASWYVALRNLAIVALMIILLYVGIRMVISSAAADKSKYKQMLLDWLVALCILFCLHYIMSFTITITQSITDAFKGENEGGNTIPVQVRNYDSSGNPTSLVVAFNTDLMGLARFQVQMEDVGTKLLYTIIYVALIIYTVMFTITYIKRAIMMAFLTLISPLVAITYPIDKISDGKAQAFNMWLKEYIFNALLQPFHLIIYTIFVGSAMELASTNLLYAIVALAFITPAEKILRKFFGFDKAGTAGSLGSFAGGAAAMGLLNKVVHKPKGGAPSGSRGIKTKENNIQGKTPELSTAFGNSRGNNTQNPEANSGGQPTLPTGSSSSGGNGNIGGANNTEPPLTPEAQAWENYGNTGSFTGTQEPQLTPEAQAWENYGNTGSFTGTQEQASTDTTTNTYGSGEYDAGTYGSGEYDTGTYGSGGIRFAEETGSGENNFNTEDSTLTAGEASTTENPQQLATQQSFTRPINNRSQSVRNMKKPNRLAGVGNVVKKGSLTLAKKAGMGALRTAGRVATALPVAALGLAAGIAGDDLDDILKYAGAGFALGGTVGYDMARSGLQGAGSFISDTYREGAYGTKEAALINRRKEYVQSEQNIQRYASEFTHDDGTELSKKELKQKLEQGAFYDGLGIEGKDAIKAVKTEDRLRKELIAQGNSQEDSERMAQAQAANIAKIAKDYTPAKLRDKDEVNNLRVSIEKELLKGNMDQATATKNANKMVKEIKDFRGVKDE